MLWGAVIEQSEPINNSKNHLNNHLPFFLGTTSTPNLSSRGTISTPNLSSREQTPTFRRKNYSSSSDGSQISTTNRAYINPNQIHIAIDWDPTALHLRYQSTRERVKTFFSFKTCFYSIWLCFTAVDWTWIGGHLSQAANGTGRLGPLSESFHVWRETRTVVSLFALQWQTAGNKEASNMEAATDFGKLT